MVDRSDEGLAVTASDLGRWQGNIDARLTAMERHATEQNGQLKEIRNDVGEIKIQQGVMRTQVALGAAIGGLMGAGAISVISGLVGG